MRRPSATLLRRVGNLEQRSPVDKPVMMLPPFEPDAAVWTIDAVREQARLKQSVRDGDIAPDYSGIVFPKLEPQR